MAIDTGFKVGQFGKIGEHMVGFELSKRGWIIFYPPYDERVDVVAIKIRCKACKSNWYNEHRIACLNSKCTEFEKPVQGINSKNRYKNMFPMLRVKQFNLIPEYSHGVISI